MKRSQQVMGVLLTLLVLASGCFTCDKISSVRKSRERYEEENNFTLTRMKAEKELGTDLEVVFRNPNYLSTNATPERIALREHLYSRRRPEPTPQQIARLIDIFKKEPKLIYELDALWLSDKITREQRLDMAIFIDRGRWEWRWQSERETIRRILAVGQMTDAACEDFLKWVRPDGLFGKALREELDDRKNLRSRMKKWVQRQKQEKEEDARKKSELEKKLAEEKKLAAENRAQVLRSGERKVTWADLKGMQDRRTRELLRGIHGTPEEFLQVVRYAGEDFSVGRHLESFIWHHGRYLPSTNLVLLLNFVVEKGRQTGTYPRYLCSGIPHCGCLSRGEFRACLPLFIEICSKGSMRYHQYRDDVLIDDAYYLLDQLFLSDYMEDEEIVLAYEQPWASTFLEKVFEGHSASLRTSEDQNCREKLQAKFKAFRKEAHAFNLSRTDYQARIVEIVKTDGPPRIYNSWFLQFRERGGSGDFVERMRPYTEVPVEEALKMAREKLRVKEEHRREEEKRYQALIVLAQSLRTTSGLFQQKVLPRLSDATLRKLVLDGVRWDARPIPVANLRALIDWELVSNSDWSHEIYSLMRRSELTSEMLLQYYPLLVAHCSRANAYHGVRGILDNPHVPKELLDRAYLEPRLAEFRLACFRSNYGQSCGQSLMSVDDILTIECEIACFGKRFGRNEENLKIVPLDITSEEVLFKVDAILKKYLPPVRPEDWNWQISMPEFDYFANDKS